MFVVIDHTINMRQKRMLNQTADNIQIFWKRLLYWKHRHVDFLTIVVDRGGVGRRGTNQLRLLERYRDVLDKHTTGIPPPTALAEGTALSVLVEGVSLR